MLFQANTTGTVGSGLVLTKAVWLKKIENPLSRHSGSNVQKSVHEWKSKKKNQ